MDEIDSLRRRTLAGLALVGGGIVAHPAAAFAFKGDESDWHAVRAAYTPQRPLMNLNNAAVSPAPIVVQDAMIKAYRFANEGPEVNMWSDLDNARPAIKAKLARLANCDPAEIALNRNSTEGLCTAIFGMELRSGDEVLICDWDYASMRKAWLQRARRDGIVVRSVQFELMDSDDAIVAAYARAITPRTKVMHITHLVHYTGRVLPAQRLCALAKAHGLLTVVDAAQSFAHIPFSFRKLDCDYLAVSLHKWLCAPFGTGMLVVRSSRIETTWPLLAPYDENPLGVAKLDHWNLGTYSSPIENAIEPAIDFHNSLGTQRIHARLRELSRYWVAQASDIAGFRVHTPMESPELGAITLFSIGNLDVEAIEKRLRDEHRIRVRFRRQSNLAGVRVSPHVYTLKSDLDRFVSALREVAKMA